MDAYSRLVKTMRSDQTTEIKAYGAAGYVSVEIDEKGNRTEFDANIWPTKKIDGVWVRYG
jgi:hypothetical protein